MTERGLPLDAGAEPPQRAAERGYLIEDSPAAAAGPSFPAVLRMVLVLALVAGIIYLVMFFLRRLSHPRVEQNPHIKVLASTHLGSGRFVHVVSLGDKAWLVGSGEGGIRHIADINDRELIDTMLLESSGKIAEEINPISGFKALLGRFSGSRTDREDRIENMRKRRERFKRF
ncbi:MAG: flagellar biosynthetic protein FliO [Treponema sp.]|nr:flagellar biosynthetic protein FliO [Treponema sp.]